MKIKIKQQLLLKILLMIILATVPTLILIGVLYSVFTRSMSEKIIAEHELKINGHILDKIDRELYERYVGIKDITDEISIKNFLAKDIQQRTSDEFQENQFRLKSLQSLASHWKDIMVIDARGKILLSTREQEVGQGIEIKKREYPLYLKVIKDGGIQYSDVVPEQDHQEQVLIFAAPLFEKNGKGVLGVVVGKMSWSAIEQILNISGDTLILTNESGDVIGANGEVLKNDLNGVKDFARAVKAATDGSVAKTVMLNKKHNYDDGDVFVSYVKELGFDAYKGHGWGLISSQSASVAFASAQKEATQIVLMTIPIIALMAGTILFIIHRLIITPINTLTKVIRISSQGDLTQHVVVVSDDEIGQLAKAFNQMTEQLREYYDNLENKVQERTLEVHTMLSELQQVNDDLKSAQGQLIQSEKLASIGQLAAGVAHEINNPVGFISNNMEMLEQYASDYGRVLRMVEQLKSAVNGKDLEQAKNVVAEISKFEDEINMGYIMEDINKLLEHNQKGIERIRKIVLDLRTFAREDTGVMDLMKIEEVIDNILSIVHSEVKCKAELIKNYGDTPLIKCHAQRLGQVFINLIVNATQAIEDKGTIEIKTYTNDGYVYIDVRDTGKGIKPENLKKIFDPFFTTKPIGQGTGLGLSISYEIIKKHGGDIKVKSKVGEGTVFTIMLPMTNEKAAL